MVQTIGNANNLLVKTPTKAEVLQTTLSKLNSKTQIPIHDVANGVYHYEIQFGTEKKVNGKLNIVK